MAASSTVARRDPTIDAAKGVAIIAIVLGHVLRGLAAAHLVKPTAAFQVADTWLYSWHLSVFALLSGLFVARAARRDGPQAYLTRRLLLFGYLYLVWSLLQGLVKLAAPAGVNVPIAWQSLLQLWLPDGQLWFLPWIAVMTVLGTLAAPWRSVLRARVTLAGAVLISLAAWGFDGVVATGAGGGAVWVIGTSGWGLLAYYLAGVWLGADRYRAAGRRAARPAVIVLAVLSLGLAALAVAALRITPPTTGGETRTPTSVLLGVVISLVCTGAVLLIARPLAFLPGIGRALAFCGRHSLEIFLAHIIATAGTRTLLLAGGITTPVVHIIAGTILGVVAPLVLWRLGPAVRMPWLFALPTVGRAAPEGIDRPSDAPQSVTGRDADRSA